MPAFFNSIFVKDAKTISFHSFAIRMYWLIIILSNFTDKSQSTNTSCSGLIFCSCAKTLISMKWVRRQCSPDEQSTSFFYLLQYFYHLKIMLCHGNVQKYASLWERVEVRPQMTTVLFCVIFDLPIISDSSISRVIS